MYKRFVAMQILRKFETEGNKFSLMYMNLRDVIICYLEHRKTRSVIPIPLEFEISKLACYSFEMAILVLVINF